MSVKASTLSPEIKTLSMHDQLFDRIVNTLNHMGKSLSGENVFMAQWIWQGTVEKYFLRYKDISDLVSDILEEHPRCWDYRKATIALMNSEPGIVDPVKSTYRGPKMWYVDREKYWTARNQMMDLSTPTGKHIFDGIINLGPNPTQGLGKDLDESRRLSSVLINKLWRTKKDFILQLSVESIRSGMLTSLLNDPIKTMQSNSYVYAALKEHSGSWE